MSGSFLDDIATLKEKVAALEKWRDGFDKATVRATLRPKPGYDHVVYGAEAGPNITKQTLLRMEEAAAPPTLPPLMPMGPDALEEWKARHNYVPASAVCKTCGSDGRLVTANIEAHKVNAQLRAEVARLSDQLAAREADIQAVDDVLKDAGAVPYTVRADFVRSLAARPTREQALRAIQVAWKAGIRWNEPEYIEPITPGEFLNDEIAKDKEKA